MPPEPPKVHKTSRLPFPRLRKAGYVVVFGVVLIGIVGTIGIVKKRSPAPPNPDVVIDTDTAAVSFVSDSVETGIRYTLSGSQDNTSEYSSKFNSVRLTELGTKSSVTRARTIKTRVEAGIKAGYDLNTGFSGNATGSASFDDATSTTYEDTYESTATQKDTSTIDSLRAQKSQSKLSWGENDGFLRTQLRVKNLSGRTIVVKDIGFDFVEEEPCTSGVPTANSIASGIIQDVNIIQGSPQSNALNAKLDSAQSPKPLELELPPYDDKYSRQVYIPGLSADLILRLVQAQRRVRLKITAYKLYYNGQQFYDYKSIPGQYTTVEIIEANNRDTKFFVKAPANGMSLVEALKKLDPEVEFATPSQPWMIKKFKGKLSTILTWDPLHPQNLSTGDGVWLGFSPAGNLNIAPVGTHFLVIYITGDELKRAQRLRRTAEITIPQINSDAQKSLTPAQYNASKRWDDGSGLVPLACFGKVSVGDDVSIRITGRALKNGQSDQDAAHIAGVADSDRWMLDWGHAHNFVPTQTNSLLKPEQFSEYKLFVSFQPEDEFKAPIPIAVFVPPCGVRSFEDGTIQIDFNISESVLPEQTGTLCFLSPIAKTQVKSGRIYTPLAVGGGDDRGILAGMKQTANNYCANWAAGDRLHDVTKFDYNELKLKVTLTQPTP